MAGGLFEGAGEAGLAFIAELLGDLFFPFVSLSVAVILSEGSVTTVGIPVGIAIIVVAFLLTGIYVRRANKEFDKLNSEIVREVEQ